MNSHWEPGQIVGDYLLGRVLGQGGMGVVLQARHRVTGALCAIKALSGNDPQERDRFEREGEALARLRHPHLLGVHSGGWHAGRPYLVLEHAPGGDLATRLLDEERLPWEDAVTLVRQLAGGLASAHRVGVVHRDIKPENVLFGSDERPLLADFGLAKLSDRTQLTQTGALMGTPLYMAPEQARGEDSAEAADVYSLGAVLFRCVSGRTPIAVRANPMSQLLALQEERPPPLRQVVDVPPWLEALVAEALALDPSARPTAVELERRLTLGEEGAPARSARGLRFALGLVPVAVGLGVVPVAVGLGALVHVAWRTGPALPSPVPSRFAPEASPSPQPELAKVAFVCSSSVLSASIARGVARLRGKHGLPPLPAGVSDQALGDVVRGREEANESSPEEVRAWLTLADRYYLDFAAKLIGGQVEPSPEELALLRHLADYGHRASLNLLGNRRAFRWRLPATTNAHAVINLRLDLLGNRVELEPVLEDLNTEGSRGTRRGHPIPQTLGAALAATWKERPARTKLWGAARVALKDSPSAALAAYLAAWRARSSAPPDLALEVERVVEWSWLGSLAALGFRQGLMEKRPGATLEALRKQADDLLDKELEWARGRYLRAVMVAPTVDLYAPEGALDRVAAAAMLPHLDRALLLDRASLETYLLRARVQHALGNTQAAIGDLRAARHVTPFDRNRSDPLLAFYLLEACKSGGVLTAECRRAVADAASAAPKSEWRERVVMSRYRELGGR